MKDLEATHQLYVNKIIMHGPSNDVITLKYTALYGSASLLFELTQNTIHVAWCLFRCLLFTTGDCTPGNRGYSGLGGSLSSDYIHKDRPHVSVELHANNHSQLKHDC